MSCKVVMKKFFLSGILDGRTTTENMNFVSWDAACEWAGRVTMKLDCNYVVLEMINLSSGEREEF